ncbi:hypothetical protein OPIT5_00030 (plasmid) [Opitutaceae bacterium TAV5]|nr:hypothetical protein OPIT5_00030 [Opitutaceae bacterium TAV5]
MSYNERTDNPPPKSKRDQLKKTFLEKIGRKCAEGMGLTYIAWERVLLDKETQFFINCGDGVRNMRIPLAGEDLVWIRRMEEWANNPLGPCPIELWENEKGITSPSLPSVSQANKLHRKP